MEEPIKLERARAIKEMFARKPQVPRPQPVSLERLEKYADWKKEQANIPKSASIFTRLFPWN